MSEKRTLSEEIELAGHEVVDFVQHLVAEGNARRVIVRNKEGRVLLEVPLTGAAVVGGAVALAAPVLAALGAAAAMMAEVKLEVEREEEP
jgi:hypothetical protein